MWGVTTVFRDGVTLYGAMHATTWLTPMLHKIVFVWRGHTDKITPPIFRVIVLMQTNVCGKHGVVFRPLNGSCKSW